MHHRSNKSPQLNCHNQSSSYFHDRNDKRNVYVKTSTFRINLKIISLEFISLVHVWKTKMLGYSKAQYLSRQMDCLVHQSALTYNKGVHKLRQSALMYNTWVHKLHQSALTYNKGVHKLHLSALTYNTEMHKLQQSALSYNTWVHKLHESPVSYNTGCTNCTNQH